jgi:hypothetical protein
MMYVQTHSPTLAIEHHAWMEDARCQQADPDLWHEDGEGLLYAKALCRMCPVVQPCLELALSYEENIGRSHGIWGGTHPKQRRQMIKDRRKAVA